MNKVEEEIIELIKKNDDRAIELIYDHYSSMIYGLIFLKCKNRTEADDLLQKVFIKIVTKKKKIAGAKYLKSYICRLALNEVNDYDLQSCKFAGDKIANNQITTHKCQEYRDMHGETVTYAKS